MASLNAVRMLFARAVHRDWDIVHADVPNAFCQSSMPSDGPDIYLNLPRGVSVDGMTNGKVLKLMKALYGLRDSPQRWNKALSAVLESLGLRRSHYDSCIFYRRSSDGRELFVAAEVDDLIITGDDVAGMAKIKSFLVEKYGKVDAQGVRYVDWESPVASFLGIDIQYDRAAGELTMSVRQKIDDLLEKFPYLSTCPTSNTPSQAAEDKGRNSSDVAEQDRFRKNYGHAADVSRMAFDCVQSGDGEDLDENALSESKRKLFYKLIGDYRSIVGSLIYIASTCLPDIAFAIGKLSRAMHDPQLVHAQWLSRTMGYLRLTKDKCKLRYTRTDSRSAKLFDQVNDSRAPVEILVGFTDANHANSRETQRKSISGYCFFLHGCCVAWKSKLQPITATSTHEAELIALSLASDEAVWMKRLCDEIGFSTQNAIPIMCDNQSTVFTVHNPVMSHRSKHLDVRMFKSRQFIAERLINPLYCPTKCNVADFFTKSLDHVYFEKFRNIIMNIEPCAE